MLTPNEDAAVLKTLSDPRKVLRYMRRMERRILYILQELRAQIGTLTYVQEDNLMRLPGKSLDEALTEALTKCLRRNNGNREATAEELGTARSTVFDWIRVKHIVVEVDAIDEAKDGPALRAFQSVEDGLPRDAYGQPIDPDDYSVCVLPGKTRKAIEREVVTKCLQRHKGNREATARELKVARSTVFQKIADFAIDVKPGSATYWARRVPATASTPEPEQPVSPASSMEPPPVGGAPVPSDKPGTAEAAAETPTTPSTSAVV